MRTATPLACLLSFAVLASAQTSPTTTPANTALVPVSRLERDSYDWFQRHSQVLEIQKKLNPEVVLIGDSITHFWGGQPPLADNRKPNGAQAWATTFGDHRVLNMGFGWDRTQNVLWRLEHSEMDDTIPKVVVLNIGTNNFSDTRAARANTPEEIAEATQDICRRVLAKSPASRIIVMGVFPRGTEASDPRRVQIKALNTLLAQQFTGKPAITFLDIGDRFLQSDGTLPKDLFPDGTHPNEKGYAIWGQALLEAGLFK